MRPGASCGSGRKPYLIEGTEPEPSPKPREQTEKKPKGRKQSPEELALLAIRGGVSLLQHLSQKLEKTELNQGRRSVKLYALGLSLPEKWLNVANLRAAAEAVTTNLSVEGEGCLLLPDWSPKQRSHLYGICLSTRSEAELLGICTAATGGKCFVKEITGSSGSWSLSNQVLATNLSRVVSYGLKGVRLGGVRALTLAKASGELSEVWKMVLSELRGELSEARACESCGAKIQGKRVDAKYCRLACRVRARRARAAQNKGEKDFKKRGPRAKPAPSEDWRQVLEAAVRQAGSLRRASVTLEVSAGALSHYLTGKRCPPSDLIERARSHLT